MEIKITHNKKIKKIFLSTTAECWPSQADFGLIKNFIINNGWALSKNVRNADIIIIYTCACRQPRENASVDLILKTLREKNKKAEVIITGCLPIINKKRLKRIFNGIAISANSLGDLEALLNPKSSIRDVKYVGRELKNKENKQLVYPLRISWGCNGKCGYCAIRFVFGRPHSRPVADILNEFNVAYGKGYRRFMLASSDAGCFGQDLGVSLRYLLDKLCQTNKQSQFALSHINPDVLKKMLPLLKPFICSGRIWRINVPVESGSNRIIRKMKREYTTNDFKYCVQKLIDFNPNLEIYTDVIVGFPTEKEEDFQETLKLIWCLGKQINNVQCLPYSNRPNTAASKMSGQVNQRVINNRVKRMGNLRKLNYLINRKIAAKNILAR